MSAYYNDNDPFCAEWLRRLIAAGAIPAGEVDERSIADVEPDDLRGFSHVHWFAGIGGWAYALRLAGFPDDRPVWSGSCPCQPFSSAGRQGGALDERHLWPGWLWLIRECRPDAILGEQVEGAVGFGWADRVFADLEAEGYACGAAVLGAHSVGAPHIRQRLFWVAHSSGVGQHARSGDEHQGDEPESRPALAHNGSAAGVLAHSAEQGWGALPERDDRADGRSAQELGRLCVAGWLADTDEAGSDRQRRQGLSGNGDASFGHDVDGCSEAGPLGYSDIARPQGRRIDAGKHAGQLAVGDSVWLPCLDGKARRTQPAIQPLAHAGECICGLRLGRLCACGEARPSRVGMLRGSGNAIAPAVAAEFIRAVLDCLP